MTRLMIKNYNKVLTEKQQKNLHYYQIKLINMNILQVKKFYHLIKLGLYNELSLLIIY